MTSSRRPISNVLFKSRVTANTTAKSTASAVADKLLNIDLSGHTIKTLGCSTAMIPEHTANALGSNTEAMHRALPYEAWGSFGWVIAVGNEDTCPMVEGHEELRALLRFAHDRGFEFLHLDCDDEVLPANCGLPTFNW